MRTSAFRNARAASPCTISSPAHAEETAAVTAKAVRTGRKRDRMLIVNPPSKAEALRIVQGRRLLLGTPPAGRFPIWQDACQRTREGRRVTGPRDWERHPHSPPFLSRSPWGTFHSPFSSRQESGER